MRRGIRNTVFPKDAIIPSEEPLGRVGGVFGREGLWALTPEENAHAPAGHLRDGVKPLKKDKKKRARVGGRLHDGTDGDAGYFEVRQTSWDLHVAIK